MAGRHVYGGGLQRGPTGGLLRLIMGYCRRCTRRRGSCGARGGPAGSLARLGANHDNPRIVMCRLSGGKNEYKPGHSVCTMASNRRMQSASTVVFNNRRFAASRRWCRSQDCCLCLTVDGVCVQGGLQSWCSRRACTGWGATLPAECTRRWNQHFNVADAATGCLAAVGAYP